MVLRIFKRKPISAAPKAKLGFIARWKAHHAEKRTYKENLRRGKFQQMTADLTNLTRARDAIIDMHVKGITHKKDEPFHQYEFRLQSARGMAFNEPAVLEKQILINKKLDELVRFAKLKSLTPSSLSKLIGEEYQVKNLGWSGRPIKKLGATPYPDLGIYFVERKKVEK